MRPLVLALLPFLGFALVLSDEVLWPGWWERSGIGYLLVFLFVVVGCGLWLCALIAAVEQDRKDQELWRAAMRAQIEGREEP